MAKAYRTPHIRASHKNKFKRNCRHNNINEVKTVLIRYGLVECILLSKNTKWKKTKYKNLGAEVIQHAKKLELSIAKNEFTAR